MIRLRSRRPDVVSFTLDSLAEEVGQLGWLGNELLTALSGAEKAAGKKVPYPAHQDPPPAAPPHVDDRFPGWVHQGTGAATDPLTRTGSPS